MVQAERRQQEPDAPRDGESNQTIETTVNGSAGADVRVTGRDSYDGIFFQFENVQLGDMSTQFRDLRRDLLGSMRSVVQEAFQSLRQDEQLDEQVAEMVGRQVDQEALPEIERWFRHDLETIREKYFVIILSLFQGLKCADLWELYQDVIRYQGLAPENKAEREALLFGETDEELLARARARIVRKEEHVAEIVEFENPDYARAVLELLRQKYWSRVLELLPWFGKLGEEPYWEVRARAAYAVAEVAKLDFGWARHQVLEVWARDERAHVRAAVGYTASRLIEDQVGADRVREMLHQWANPESTRGWRYRWAAAAAYKQIGQSHPDIAFQGLELAARNDDIRVADAVVYALLVISLDDKLKEVLCALQGWLDQDPGRKKDSNSVPLVATLAFLALGNAHTGLASKPAEGEGEEKEDAFLSLLASDASGECQQVVRSALHRALEYRLLDDALAILESWACESETNESRLWAIRDLLAGWYMELWAKKHEIGLNRVLNELKRWAKDESWSTRQAAAMTRAEIDRRVRGTPAPAPPRRIIFG